MAERQKTFEIIKTKTNIGLSINETKIENLKLLLDSDSLSSLKALGKFIKYSLKKKTLNAKYGPHYDPNPIFQLL